MLRVSVEILSHAIAKKKTFRTFTGRFQVSDIMVVKWLNFHGLLSHWMNVRECSRQSLTYVYWMFYVTTQGTQFSTPPDIKLFGVKLPPPPHHHHHHQLHTHTFPLLPHPPPTPHPPLSLLCLVSTPPPPPPRDGVTRPSTKKSVDGSARWRFGNPPCIAVHLTHSLHIHAYANAVSAQRLKSSFAYPGQIHIRHNRRSRG